MMAQEPVSIPVSYVVNGKVCACRKCSALFASSARALGMEFRMLEVG